MIAEITDTTTSMTALRASMRSAHRTWKSPEATQVNRSTVVALPMRATSWKATTDSTAETVSGTQVASWAARSPIARPKKPAMTAPASGRKTSAA